MCLGALRGEHSLKVARSARAVRAQCKDSPLVHGPTPLSIDPPPRPWTHPLVHGPTPSFVDPPRGPWTHPLVHGRTTSSMGSPSRQWTHIVVRGPTLSSMDPPHGPWTHPLVHGPTPSSMDAPPRPWPRPLVHGRTPSSMEAPPHPWTVEQWNGDYSKHTSELCLLGRALIGQPRTDSEESGFSTAVSPTRRTRRDANEGMVEVTACYLQVNVLQSVLQGCRPRGVCSCVRR